MIHIARMNEFAGFMTGQGWRDAPKSSIVRCSQSLRIHYGRELKGAPSAFFFILCETLRHDTYTRTMGLGPFVGPIYTIILIVDCLFFALLEWWMPREDIDYVDVKWDAARFETVGCL